ncbi:MarR family winged helix-turn-helix transcriptional regulator [Spirillospora sp. NBC_00431]
MTPTQAQALELLRKRPASLGDLAAQLGISAATASNAVGTLVHKGLVVKEPGANKRSVTLRLTEAGESLADQASEWPDVLNRAVETLDPEEQTALLRSLVKLITAPTWMNRSATGTCAWTAPSRPTPHPSSRNSPGSASPADAIAPQDPTDTYPSKRLRTSTTPSRTGLKRPSNTANTGQGTP